MTKKLLVQIKNEWRNNLWLALELLVVSVVMWFVVDYLYTRTATYLEPRGFDISHCYLIEMGKLTDKSPDYIPNQTDEQEDADILELVDRLRRRPEIEAVSLSQNSYPYNGSNSTDLVQYDTLVSGNWTIRRLVTPDFVRVFRYQGTRGETPEQLAGMLERGEFLASDNLYRKWSETPDTKAIILRYMLVIAILLLVPAINLSSMTLSRMRRRMAEIGVRKAFGATGGELIRQIFFENLLLTLFAGVLGLALSYAATFLLNGFLFNNSTNAYLSGETALTPGMLLSPWAFLAAFGFCLLMNILSAGIPAWRASRMNITDAINQR